MIPQRPHPRRTAPTGVPFPRRTLRRTDAQILLPEDFIHEAGRSPVALRGEFQEDGESDSPPRGQGAPRVYGSQAPIPLQGDEPSLPPRQGNSRWLFTSRPPIHPHDNQSDEDRLIQRNIEVFRRRLRAGLIAPVYYHSQQTRRPPLLFQDMEQPSRQSRRRPRSPSPIPHPSRRRRLTLTSNDSCIEVALSEAAASAVRRSHAAGPEPEAEPVYLPPPYPRNTTISNERLNERLAEIGPRRAPASETAHLIPLPRAPQADPFRPPPPYSPRIPSLHPAAYLIPLPTAPQADRFRPPPPYSPRNPRLHPTGEDYDLTPNLYHRPHNNDAPPLPLYTPVARLSERVLQFGGSEDEQRNAFVRFLQKRNRQEREREEAIKPAQARSKSITDGVEYGTGGRYDPAVHERQISLTVTRNGKA
ncbi:hypothetical protein N0V85_006314 [Neurospora sp. IMI 360204]|nr:hypothetical protein N0V85_006314 [Neurospora sp. IMI 360204]